MEPKQFGRLVASAPGRFSRRSATRGIGAGLAGVAFGLGAASSSAQDATPAGDEQAHGKVVLHVSDPDGWPPALSNLRNLTTDFPAIEVLVVVDGGGVYIFQGSNDLTSELARVAEAGVRIQACHNALKEKQIDSASMPGFVEVVPGGVPALVAAQDQGFRYVKP